MSALQSLPDVQHLNLFRPFCRAAGEFGGQDGWKGRLPIIGGSAREVTMLASDDDQVMVVRFWPEDETTEWQPSRHWRARIIYVNTGQQFYAPSIADAFAVMSSLVLTGKYHN